MNLINCKSALKNLNSGLPVIFQTDTLPAIGCLPKFSQIIYEFKKRDRNKPLILMGSEHKQLCDYVHESAKEDFENIASKYWPGALTMVIPCSKKETAILTSSDFTLGLFGILPGTILFCGLGSVAGDIAKFNQVLSDRKDIASSLLTLLGLCATAAVMYLVAKSAQKTLKEFDS